MDPRYLLRRSLAWAATAVLCLSPGAVVTPAEADGGDPNLVHACAGPKGQLRLVGANERCSYSNETPVHWPATASGGALQVVDSLGQHVGYPSLLGPQVARQVGDVWLLLPVSAAGFFPPAFPPSVAFPMFEARDCQGTPLLRAAPGFFQGVFSDGTDKIVYPGGAIALRTLESIRFSGICSNFAPFAQLTGVLTELDLSTLAGLVPPFNLQ